MNYSTIQMFLGDPPGGSLQKICTLINSACYFISDVYIVEKDHKGYFRLCAAHQGKTLIHKEFETLRGAKIAFAKLFKHRCGKQDIRSHWSHFYEPDLKWLKNRGGSAAAQ